MTDSWQSSDSLTPERRLEVLNLLNRTESTLGREAIDEGRRRIVVHGWRAEHWLQYHEGLLVNYAMATGTANAILEMCGGGIDEDLLQSLLEHHESLDWWTRGSTVPVHAQCKVMRTLQLMEVALPVPVVDVPEGATLHNFEPGRDEDAWLEQNNAAFAHHPEQGAWLRSDLEERTSEPWFDPSGFLLLEIDGRLAASCWTKVHELHPDRFGEIYIISVHPDFQGHNLGRVMVTQGLEVLRRKGVTMAMLFVDQSNVNALALYESLGFKVVRDDRLVHFQRG
ncbi:MAG TPA: mycothiol synthase [Acidimicrobiales bacterium]|nr:mycothiol synthase [Acidimicrobiales bacterium]